MAVLYWLYYLNAWYCIDVHGARLTDRQPSDYVLDTTTIYERRGVQYRLYFRKVLWSGAPRSDKDNVAYITMIFDQVGGLSSLKL